jgi:hypothetical protein
MRPQVLHLIVKELLYLIILKNQAKNSLHLALSAKNEFLTSLLS